MRRECGVYYGETSGAGRFLEGTSCKTRQSDAQPAGRTVLQAANGQRYGGRGRRPDQTFPLRGVKDSPPYLHDGRLLTLDDAVEFFNLILGTKLTEEEEKDLVAFMLTL